MSCQWKLVPVEPTETMVIHGFESAPDEFFSDEEVWEQYQEMSGCQQAAFRAKLCWAAMLAAAHVPQQADLDRVIVQPAPVAPVAVVLPERKSVNTHNSHDWDEGYADGWVAYDTELKRLNPSL